MNGVYLFKIEAEKTPHLLAAHGVKIDFMVGYFTWSTDFCVLLAMFLIACYIHFRLQDFYYFLGSLLFTMIKNSIALNIAGGSFHPLQR